MLFVYPLRDASQKMHALVTRDDAKIARLAISWNQPHYRKRYPLMVSYPDYAG